MHTSFLRIFNLQRSRYSVWKLRLCTLLNELDVIKVIDEEIPAERDDSWKKN